MSGVITAAAVIVGGATILASKSAGGAARAGAATQAGAQREALEYLKEREAIPRQVSEAALTKLAGLYGLDGGTGVGKPLGGGVGGLMASEGARETAFSGQQELIDSLLSSPLYQSIMGGREAGEEAILRSTSATGGLRSGNVQEALYDYNTQLRNKALLESYNQQLQGLAGLAGLPSNANQIAERTAGIGQTLGQGQIAAGQAQQVGIQQAMGNMLGVANLGITAYEAGMFSDTGMFSDRRLKNNIEKIGELNGHNWYMWDWNIVANKMGLEGKAEGVLADELVNTNPECIGILDGFMIVDYIKLGIFPGGTA